MASDSSQPANVDRASGARAKFDALPKDVRTYLIIFGLLLAMLVLTVAVAYCDLGAVGNLAVALTIAIVKAVLVVLFFMHVKEASHVTWIFAGSAFLWLAIMIALTMADYATRNHTPGQIPDSPNPVAKVAESPLLKR